MSNLRYNGARYDFRVCKLLTFGLSWSNIWSDLCDVQTNSSPSDTVTQQSPKDLIWQGIETKVSGWKT